MPAARVGSSASGRVSPRPAMRLAAGSLPCSGRGGRSMSRSMRSSRARSSARTSESPQPDSCSTSFSFARAASLSLTPAPSVRPCKRLCWSSSPPSPCRLMSVLASLSSSCSRASTEAERPRRSASSRIISRDRARRCCWPPVILSVPRRASSFSRGVSATMSP